MNTSTSNFPQSSKSNFQSAVRRIRELPPKQLVGLSLVLLLLPMIVTATLHQVLIGSKAWNFIPYPISSPETPDPGSSQPGTAPITPPLNPGDDENYADISYPKHNPIIWKTPYAYLSADSFYIEANGKKFVGNGDFTVKSDPPNNTNPDQMTLEVTWFENDTEMRFYVYFDKLNGNWWSNNFRTYNGSMQSPDWIYFNDSQTGEAYFAHMIGHSFWHMDDYAISSPDGRGKIVFKDLRIKAFTDEQRENTDFNQDGYIDLLDYHQLVKNYGATHEEDAGKADLNGDGRVDMEDFNIFVKSF